MAQQETRPPATITDAIHRAMQAHGLSARELVQRIPDQNVATIYKILSGETAAPRLRTLLAICRALTIDPDDLLHAHRPALDPEFGDLLKEAEALPEEDRWVLVRTIRAVSRQDPGTVTSNADL